MDLESLVEGEVGEMPIFSTAVRGLHIGHFFHGDGYRGVKKVAAEKRIRDQGKVSLGTRKVYPRKPRTEKEKALRKRYYYHVNRCLYK